MKYCKHCNKDKPYSEFYKRKASKDGYQGRCKSCDDKKIKQYLKQPKRHSQLLKRWRKAYEDSKDGLHHVYICTDVNYAGITNSPQWREIDHKIKKGASREHFRVIYSTPDREEGLELESLLHDIGYAGRHVNNMYK